MIISAFSDLHISGRHDPVLRGLIREVQGLSGADHHLVLAGDIFDLFVGENDVFVEEYRELLEALKEAGTRGVQVHYIEGNHDFLLHHLLESWSIQHVQESVSLEADGYRVYLAHGDLADQTDQGYLRLRRFFRSRFAHWLEPKLPQALIKWIGDHWIKLRHEDGAEALEQRDPDRIEYIRQQFRAYAEARFREGHQFVVMGHCHDLDEHWVEIDGRRCQYINMGFPRVHGTYLRWDSQCQPDAGFKRQKMPI